MRLSFVGVKPAIDSLSFLERSKTSSFKLLISSGEKGLNSFGSCDDSFASSSESDSSDAAFFPSP